MSTGLVAFLLFVVAFIVRGANAGFELEDYVLWMLAGLGAITFSPVLVLVQRQRKPSAA